MLSRTMCVHSIQILDDIQVIQTGYLRYHAISSTEVQCNAFSYYIMLI